MKTAAGSWDRNLSNLAKLALAGLYHQTGRDSEAIDLYNAWPPSRRRRFQPAWRSLTWPTCMRQTGKQDQARALWAKVKDADKDGAAGQIATQKLAGKQ